MLDLEAHAFGLHALLPRLAAADASRAPQWSTREENQENDEKFYKKLPMQYCLR